MTINLCCLLFGSKNPQHRLDSLYHGLATLHVIVAEAMLRRCIYRIDTYFSLSPPQTLGVAGVAEVAVKSFKKR